MLYRRIRVAASGEYLEGALFGTEGDAFSTPAERHIEDVAAGFGLDPTTLEAVEGETDPMPRDATIIAAPPASAGQAAEEALTDAELKELRQVIAERTAP